MKDWTQKLLNFLKCYLIDVFTVSAFYCESDDIMLSLCGIGRVCIHMNNFSSKTARPSDMLFFFKDTLSNEDEKLFKACKSVRFSVC